MPKILFCGKGGSGKSTLLALLALFLGERNDVFVVDADESNPGLARMMGLDAPRQTLMENLGGKMAFRKSMGKKTAAPEEKDLLGGTLQSMESLPSPAASRSGRLTLVSIGKIEHTHEGCACPMGVLARTFINHVSLKPGQWILVDTEAGVEHFGRGILDGVDAVVAIVDPSHDALMLVGKIRAMAGESGKRFHVVLNRTDEDSEDWIRADLEKRKIGVACTLPYSREILRANLRALPLDINPVRENLQALLKAIEA
jgi:CO dehydrogenase maturation factor